MYDELVLSTITASYEIPIKHDSDAFSGSFHPSAQSCSGSLHRIQAEMRKILGFPAPLSPIPSQLQALIRLYLRCLPHGKFKLLLFALLGIRNSH